MADAVALPATALRWRAWAPALLTLAAGLLALFALFQTEALAAVRVWRDSTAFGHCFLVAPIAGFLAWERRDALTGLSPRPLPWLAALALPAIAVWFAAERLGIMEGRQFAVLGLVWLLAFAVLGLRIGWAMAVPLAYLVFLVPFGAFLVPALQVFTAHFIDAGLAFLDIPHVVTATLIEIPEGTFRVAEACAGLRFLIAAIAFGALYACVIYRGPWRRVAFIAVCVAVPVLANGVRALGIVVLGHIKGSAQAGAVDHVVYGWLFFSLVILLLLLLGLPFRQDSLPFTRRLAVRPMPPGGLPVPLAAGVAVLLLAATGPAAATWLDRRGQAETAALADGAVDRLAAALATPAGCTSEAPRLGRRRFACGAVLLEVRLQLFGGQAGPAALAAWRDARSMPASEDDPESMTLDLPGARWQVQQLREPPVTQAAALWLDGRPAPDGMALRLRLAQDGLDGGGAPLLLAGISTEAASPVALAAVEGFARAQAAAKSLP